MLRNPLFGILLMDKASKSDKEIDAKLSGNEQIDFVIPFTKPGNDEDLDHKRMKKLLQSSKKIHFVNISESKFNTMDWTTISEGLAKNKSLTQLRLHSISITTENITFISNIIGSNASLESIRFDHWTIQPECFEGLCRSLADAPKLFEIELSSNTLSEEQVQKLKSTFETIFRLKRLTIFRDPIYVACNKEQANKFAKSDNRFIIVGVKDLVLTKDDPIDRHWAYALRTNQTIETLELQSIYKTDAWKSICEGIADQTSIRKLVLTGTGLSMLSAPHLLEAIRKNTHITHLDLNAAQFEDAAISNMADAIRFGKLTNVRLNGVLCTDPEAFIQAAYDNKNIKALRISKMKLPNRIWNIISNSHISELRLSESELPKVPDGHDMKIGLMSLGLEKMKEFPESLLAAAKSSDTLKELRLTTSKSLFPIVSDILSVNTHLTHLSLVMPLSSQDITAISEVLQNNRSLKGLELRLPQDSAEILCQALVLNETLEDLAIIMPHEFLNDSYYASFGNVFAMNKSIRSIRLPTNTDKIAADMFVKLKYNNTLTHLDLQLPGPVFTSNNVYSALTTVLQDNRALTYLQSGSEIKQKIVDKLAENKKLQQEFVRSTNALITMMKLRLDAFEDIVPLEVWALVFKQLRHPGVNIDFSAELLRRLKN